MKNYEEIKKYAVNAAKQITVESGKVVLYTAYFNEFVAGLNTISEHSLKDFGGYCCSHEVKIAVKKINNRQVCFCGPLPQYNQTEDLQNFKDTVRLLKEIGADKLLLLTDATAVSGSVDTNQPLIISDHINLTTFNPLIGHNDEKFGVRFPDMSEAYDQQQVKLLAEKIRQAGLEDTRVIAAVLLVNDAVDELTLNRSGVSVVIHSAAAEVITAVHCKMTCAALAFVPGKESENSRQQIYNRLNILDSWF